MTDDHHTRADVDEELICEDCHRRVDRDERRCPRCWERWRAGF